MRQAIVDLIISRGYERRADPFQLTSGEWSHDYIDAKRAIARGEDLKLVARELISLAADEGVEFDAVGGMTLGADPLAYSVALESGKEWFVVRKEVKKHGKQKRIEGAELKAGTKVLLVEDVISTGGSILTALDVLQELGVDVVLAAAIVDRGKTTADKFAERGVKFRPLCTYEDLGIDPIGLRVERGGDLAH